MILVLAGLVSLFALAGGLSFSYSDGLLVCVAIAVLLATVVEAAVIQQSTKTLLGLHYGVSLKSVSPFVVSAVVMVAVVWGFRSSLIDDLGIPLQAFLWVAREALTYLVVGRIWFKAAFTDQLSAVRSLVSRSPTT